MRSLARFKAFVSQLREEAIGVPKCGRLKEGPISFSFLEPGGDVMRRST
jgi:hypothetical protein